MSKPTDKQLQQVYNIFQTLSEASDHFHKLIKEKELNQSIFIFSSIVDGFQALSRIDAVSKIEEWHIRKNKAEKHLLDIAQLLEKGNFIKISEILQFSFLPLLNKITKDISKSMDDQKSKKYKIGVFASFHNPRAFYPEARVNALVQESERQNTQLLFFTSTDVNFEKEVITADVYTDGKWERITTHFPDVINNVGAGKRSHIERKLRRVIPFTSFHVGNKLSLPMRMAKYKKYVELLVPFRLCRNEVEIHEFLKDNNKVVFKYLQSNRGENIYFVTKKGTRYAVQEHKNERILSQEAFEEWLQTVILEEKGSFIVQRYIHTRTKEDEPYHFRAHVQKNGEGKWGLTHIYPRLGNRKSNLSNVATDGRVDNFHDFLVREYGGKAEKYESDILRLSIEIALHLDKLYGLALDELGIDLAIDENGRYWMHEANNGPQTAYHEEKRAVNTIAYAKYIAKNGIFYTESLRKSWSGMFQARTANIALAELDNRTTVGVLQGKIVNDSLATTLAETAERKNIHLYTFTPKDVDYDEMLIKGHFYEDNKWIPKIVEYPDAIIDRLQLRGDEDAQWIYEELEDIAFTNKWTGRKYKKSGIYKKLQASEEINDILAPYQKVSKTRDIFSFIEKYGKVILKLESGNISGTQYIEKLSNGKYFVTKGTSVTEYSEFPLLNKLKELIKEDDFIVQKDARSLNKNGQPTSFSMQLIQDKVDKWKFISLFADLKANPADNTSKNLTEELTEFLRDNYGEKEATELESKIKELAKTVGVSLQKIYGNVVTEVTIELGIDNNQHLSLIEVNPNSPNTIYDTATYAENVISYASYLGLLTKSNDSFVKI
ncbi:YheC/YheD family protein [Oceanobacillus profundus]|uniref:YheC/YheD family protein n=1 Tax=Oceanobacillus TaxID=182709 RepID=UPI0026E1DEC5|nr:YheC/YheD family protein [Oceanobacillus profundus]MDO6450833.1 YheC/YheD family protein [Oceanobacillus profundus]